MRYLVLSRPIVNAGDYLFTERSLILLRHLRPDIEFISGHVSDGIDIDYLNSFDSIIVAGGPIFDNRFLTKEAFPLLNYLDDLKPRIHFFCNGFYGKSSDVPCIYIYIYDKNVIEILKKIEYNGGKFAVRDYITEAVLRNNGLSNVFMTGCSAWYDLDYIDKSYIAPDGIKNIIISDPGMTKDKKFHTARFFQVASLVSYVLEKFPGTNIKYTFNGGIYTKYSTDFNLRVKELLEKSNIPYYDISGSADGFKIYNDCDLHIGYRVHSHIYCLSRRISSVLIEEDSRGAGVNGALGLPSIRNYERHSETEFIPNPYLLDQIELYLNELMRENYSRLHCAVERMQAVYQKGLVPFVMNL